MNINYNFKDLKAWISTASLEEIKLINEIISDRVNDYSLTEKTQLHLLTSKRLIELSKELRR